MDNKTSSVKSGGQHKKTASAGSERTSVHGKHEAITRKAMGNPQHVSSAASKSSGRTGSARANTVKHPAETKKTAYATRKKSSKKNRNANLIRFFLVGIGVLAAGLAVWLAIRSGSKDIKSDVIAATGSMYTVQVTASQSTPTATPHLPSHKETVMPLAQDDEPDDFVDDDNSWDAAETETSPESLNLFANDTDNENLSGELLVFDLTPTEAPAVDVEPTPTPVPTAAPKPVKLGHVYEIEVDKSKQVVTVYTVGEEGYYNLIVKQFICSTGHCDKVEDGWYTIGEKSRWKKMGNGSYAQYASRISGPYLFHSGCYYEQRNSQLKVRYYENLGTNASSGCIRLTCGDAYWIYTNCPKGTPIHVITSGVRDEELLKALEPPALISQKYDPTDPDTPAKYQYVPEVAPTPDPTPVPIQHIGFI